MAERVFLHWAVSVLKMCFLCLGNCAGFANGQSKIDIRWEKQQLEYLCTPEREQWKSAGPPTLFCFSLSLVSTILQAANPKHICWCLFGSECLPDLGPDCTFHTEQYWAISIETEFKQKHSFGQWDRGPLNELMSSDCLGTPQNIRHHCKDWSAYCMRTRLELKMLKNFLGTIQSTQSKHCEKTWLREHCSISPHLW